MRLRWFHSVAGLTVLAMAACLTLPGPAFAVTPKTKAVPGKGAQAEPRGKAVPAPIQPIIGPIDTQAKHALVIAAETGAVLLDKAANERIPPASMSKVMTAYIVFDMLKQGRAKLDDELPVSEHAWRTQGSKMFVPIGARIKIDDLLRGMIVQSGNDACVVLAEGLAGSEAAFVDLMNQKGQQIGLTNSHFADVGGLPNPDHWMSARDLAALALRTINDFPEYYHYYGEKDYNFNNINQGNRNPLLYKDIGADGLKTGHTEEAGYSLLASVHRDKRRIILVLGGLPSMKARAQESERLFSAGEKVDDAEIWLGTEPKVALTVGRDLVVTLPRKSRKDMKVTVTYDKPVPAPVKKGQEIGRVSVTAPDVAPIEAPLVAATDVDRMGPFGRMAMVAANLIWGKH